MRKQVLTIAVALSGGPVLSQEGHAEKMKEGIALFQKTIRPALIDNCLKCHGDEKVRSGLDLSTRNLLLEGGDSEDAINLEKPGESYLLTLIRHEEEDLEMPPKKDKLPDSLIADFEKWIALGAPYDKPLLERKGERPAEMRVTDSDREFWSFKPLAKVAPPKAGGKWVKGEIDQFVAEKLQQNNLLPNSQANDRDRIRRAYLSVIGLPPTADQLKAALSMSHVDLVDELLASPHYGERWARHWLDAARFAESHGFEQDYNRKYAYHYRDFVIKALNANMPWDEFVRLQVAGDEIDPENPLAMMATGFLGAGVFPTQLTEKEFESARYDELDDMAATTGTAMLGLTIGCARCHDHKFDPIPVKDYYRFVANFTTTIRSEIDVNLDSEEYQLALKEWQVRDAQSMDARAAFEANPKLVNSFERWLKTDARSSVTQSEWMNLGVKSAVSSHKATKLKQQADGAILAVGAAGAKEIYTVKSAPPSGMMRFLRVEALTDSSMKRKGPGRASNGNFALSNLKLLAVSSDGEKRELKLVGGKATHQQNKSNLSVASSIDGNFDGTGWAVDSGGIGKDQAAVFELEKATKLNSGEMLEVELRFSNNTQHSLGRFRLSVSGNPAPSVRVGGGKDSAISAALEALAKGKLDEKQRKVLFQQYLISIPEWVELDAAVRNSLGTKPKPSVTKVQVTSEGFKPTKHHADGRGFPHFYPETHFLSRGDPNQKKGVANAGFLQVLINNGKASADWQKQPPAGWNRTSYRRTGLANWMTDVENGAGHLLARVAVNRIWHHHFGRGIVSTPNDFGLQGKLPSHPELLDYMARRFIASGWDVKALHRDIMLSATWQQSSAPSPKKAAADPDNQFLWRFTPRRLEAEIVRDSILASAGQLDTKMYGPGTLDERHRRRSIYFMIKRSRLVPMMQIFDQPEPLSSQGSRPSTTIAPQALLFMNNPQVVSWAGALAASVSSKETDEAIRELYRRTLSRDPTSTELRDNRAFIDAQASSYQGVKNAKQLAYADFCQVIFSLNEFVYLP